MAWMVPDELWAIVAPLLPPPPSHTSGGRPRIPNRNGLAGILFILRSGCPWSRLPAKLGCGSGSTCWRRLRDWQAAGVWRRLERTLLQQLSNADQIDWSRASIDSTSVPAKGGEATGPNPTDRGKAGSKRHLVKVHADKAYDVRHCRSYCWEHHIGCRIARIGIESSDRLGRQRWMVERTGAWYNRFRRLQVRDERRAEMH